MINQDLLFYVKAEQKRGVDRERIRQTLIKEGGWQIADVDAVFSVIVDSEKKAVATEAVVAPVERKPQASAPLRVAESYVDPNLYTPTHAKASPLVVGPTREQVVVKERRRTHYLRAFLVTFGMLCLLGGAGYYIYAMYLFPNKERVVTSMNYAWQDVQNFSFDITATTHSTDEVRTPFGATRNLLVHSLGDVGIGDPGSPWIDTKWEITADGDKNPNVFTGTLIDAVAYLGDSAHRFVPPVGSKSGPDEKFSLPLIDLPLLAALVSGPETDITNKAKLVQNNFSNTFFSRIKKTIERGTGLVVFLELPKETLDGQAMRRYNVALDVEKEAVLFEELYLSFFNQPPTAGTSKAVEQFLNTFSFTNGEVWIGVRDQLPHKLLFTATVKNGGVRSFETNVVMHLTNFNRLTAPEKPAHDKNLIASIKDGRDASRERSIEVFLQEVHSLSEIFYASKHTYLGLCGNLEKEISYQDAKKDASIDLPYCHDAKDGYAFAVPYAKSDSTSPQYYCTNQNGDTIKGSIAPTNNICNSEVSTNQ